jgi:hypothetical protein
MKKQLATSNARVTREVDPAEVQDLLAHPPRATVAFVDAGEVDVVPVRARLIDGAHAFAVQGGAIPDLAGREVVLIRDDGPYWFELRGVSVRGLAHPRAAPGTAYGPPLAWYSVEPRRVLAWDYGQLHDV